MRYSALLTDLYELTMLAGYLRRRDDRNAGGLRPFLPP